MHSNVTALLRDAVAGTEGTHSRKEFALAMERMRESDEDDPIFALLVSSRVRNGRGGGDEAVVNVGEDRRCLYLQNTTCYKCQWVILTVSTRPFMIRRALRV